jgi:hypothetical protein
MPPNTEAANVAFLPWVRQGAAAALTTVDTLAATQNVPVELTAALALNSAPPVSVDVRLLGPGDVAGIDPQQIVRTDPRPGSVDFEPNYFPAIEFDRPDFPWLFTPAAADATARLRPWLVLVVVRRQDGVRLRPSEGTLPVLEIGAPARPAEELPDLAESWAWAHAQASRADGIGIGAALGGRPELSLSRLICPRLLVPETDYLACVVPAFETGRKAGLGEAVPDGHLGRLAPAWTLTPAPVAVSLPVYHHWSFRTAIGGDFVELVRLLAPQPAPAGLGTRPIDISRPGFKLPPEFPAGATLPVGGALQPIAADEPAAAWPTGTQALFQAALAPIVNAAGDEQVSPPGSDPLLAPPLYGRWHAARARVQPGVADNWFDLLNLDPRFRVVAAFGTRVVQEHQEALMASAWEQAGDVQRANQRLRQLQLGLFVGASLHARHFNRMSDDGLMRVSAPGIARVRPAAGGGATLFGQLTGSAVPVKAVGAAMRRLVRPRGPVSRRVAALVPAGSGTASFITKLNIASASFITPPVPDVVTFNVVRKRLENPSAVRIYQKVTEEFVATFPPFGQHFLFRVVPEGQPVVLGPRTDIDIDTPPTRAFRAAAREHLMRVNPARPTILFGPPVRNAFDQIRVGVLAEIDPRRTVRAFARVMVGGSAEPPPPPPPPPPGTSAPAPVDPVMTSPKFPQPMYETLRELSQDLLLPGLEQVAPNSVIGLETNRRFVEAYIVGLNFEMGRELLWRGFPTDQRGTCFDQFWDTRGAPVPRPDVTPLHTWGGRGLGDPLSGMARERFVMLMRSDLLRRYPSAIVYATRAVVTGGVRMPSTLPADESYPAFRGTMEPDLYFFGFDLTVEQMTGEAADGTTTPGFYIVIEEQPTEPRFGLDVGTDTGGATHLGLAGGAPHPPPQGLSWGRNAAHMAGILRQQPVRIAIHASQLVPPS